MSSNQYWNRETSERNQYSQDKQVTQPANIICLTDPNDDANRKLYDEELPKGAKILTVASQIDDFNFEKLKEANANVVFVSHPKAREPLAKLLEEIPSIKWVHSRSAGVDFITSETLANSNVYLTNAKGCFSSTLAEYTLMAISYFAKDLPRLLKQKQDKNWEKYPVEEIRGATLGVVGYGDIGRAAAKLAKAYGMKVIALRRNPEKSMDDPVCDVVYKNSKESLHQLMSESDYVLCAAPLTPETKNMFDEAAFSKAKPNSVFINVGRGPIVDETALTCALKNGPIKGAALDVFAVEPLPIESELWDMPNLLASPHNMDMTKSFMHEATQFFIDENLPRFLREEPLLNQCDKAAGY